MAKTIKFKKKFIPLYIIGFIIFLYLLFTFMNIVSQLGLRIYINSFEEVNYTNQLIPEYDEELGHYTFTKDGDLKVVLLSDIHLGGGFISYNDDKETIKDIITILQNEKPDLVIMDGDNVFPRPTCSGTHNNYRGTKTLLQLFKHEKVYFTTAFGNHESEWYATANRKRMGKLYENAKYSVFKSEFNEHGVSNQIICVKNTDGVITKNILLLDSNSNNRESIWRLNKKTYDVIFDCQVYWAKNELNRINNVNAEYIDTLVNKDDYQQFKSLKTNAFCHVPLSELELAYQDLYFNETPVYTTLISGVFDESFDERLNDGNGRIFYGGFKLDKPLGDEDICFESLSQYVESFYFGHDHLNNAVVNYKGIILGYNYSIDNLTYDDIDKYGLQRGCTVFNIDCDTGITTAVHKNLYISGYIWEEEHATVNLITWPNDNFQGK